MDENIESQNLFVAQKGQFLHTHTENPSITAKVIIVKEK